MANATPKGKTAIPKAVHTKKYPAPASTVSQPTGPCHFVPKAWRYRNSIGTRDGIIIAIIITTHIPRNDNAEPGQSCPGIHVIDIVQPPGIGMPPILDMDAPQTIVIAVLATKSSADTPKKV
ncbi:MAG TPA: hypothetical protein VGS79_08425 [Puia sp.]|nr:hypothetical protein [Puia sp.]